jgi:hypothetical protein
MLNAVNRVCLLSLMNPHVMLVEYEMYSRLFIFYFWIKIPDGYQISKNWSRQACDQPVSCPCGVESSPEDRSCLSAVCYLRLYLL